MKPLRIRICLWWGIATLSATLVGPLRARAEAPPPTDLGAVDFRYSPPWWQTAVCLPDDPDKALVGKEGQFLFDFGKGGVRNFGTCLQPEIVEGTEWVRQQTLSARVPIVQTWKRANGIDVLEEAFVVPDMKVTVEPARIERTDGKTRLENWAKPVRACASAFTGVDVSNGGAPIRLQLHVPAGASRTIVFGLCEGWHKEPGQRPLVLQAEGTSPRGADPVKDFGANEPGLYKLEARDENRDGRIEINVSTLNDAKDRNAILNALWAFDGPVPSDEKILKGETTADVFYTGTTLPARRCIVFVTLKNPSNVETTRQPALRIQSVEPVRLSDSKTAVLVGPGIRITALYREGLTLSSEKSASLVLQGPVTLKPCAETRLAWIINHNVPELSPLPNLQEVMALRDTASSWWEHADLPFDTIHVPDPGIQAMLESCVRNIWQAREIKNGLPAFHVGPTVYRGLWVVDGSFLLESAALLGRGQDARAGIEYLLSHQKPDGSFEILPHFWKENGIVLWAATRHAVLTQDKDWLKAHWPALQRVVATIQRMRAATKTDPNVLQFGLLPPGEVDGGISNRGDKPEFSNTYWCLAGLKAAIAAAHWIGDEASATAWQAEYDDFLASFRKAAVRDMRADAHGNKYIPTMMADIDHHVPQRGQWAFCHAVYPGMVFALDDPILQGQMAMLRACKQEGLIYDTGWMHEGIWNYFASFYGHAVLWQGNGREAAEVLYDFARHASPTRVWREEQKPVGKGNEEVGDMPHNWASAEFIRLTTHLIELDRGDELHLLEGFPHEWAGPGMVTRLQGVLTPFGPLNFEVRIADDGTTARVKLSELKGRRPGRIVLHLDGLTGMNRPVELPADRDVEQSFPRGVGNRAQSEVR